MVHKGREADIPDEVAGNNRLLEGWALKMVSQILEKQDHAESACLGLIEGQARKCPLGGVSLAG